MNMEILKQEENVQKYNMPNDNNWNTNYYSFNYIFLLIDRMEE